MNDIINQSWQPPAPPEDGDEMISEVDPRVDGTHAIGVLPCPNNPPPPDGWRYWKGTIPNGGGALASSILDDPEKYPMGTFVQTRLNGMLVGARVEWHTLQGATGKTGCFRGVNLMRAVDQ